MPLREKKNFFPTAKAPTAIKLEEGGGGGQSLNVTTIKKKYTFLRLPLPGKETEENDEDELDEEDEGDVEGELPGVLHL